MTMTGDWTVVNNASDDVGENHNDGGENTNGNETFVPAQTAPPSPPPPAATIAVPKAAVRFPCSEQPPRFALRSRNGYYLGNTKKGRLLGRKKRHENDEWTIAFSEPATTTEGTEASATVGFVNNNNNNTEEDENGIDTNQNRRPVTIHNHKFGGILSLIDDNRSDLGRIAACITPPQQEDVPSDLGLGEQDDSKDEAAAATNAPEQLPDDEADEDDEDLPISASSAKREDLQWSIVPCSGADHPNGGVTIVSLKTGDRLGVTDRGKTILCPKDSPVPSMISFVWELKCVTGELCFLSNPSLDARIRCDMAGLLTLSPNWKGWEVVRITEASSAPYSSSNRNSDEHQGYVRISSWMHSQWFLCSDASGTVGSCSVAESLAPPPATQELAALNNYRCALWAIEKKTQPSGDDKHEGVVLRSVTHDRILSIRDGVLRTHDHRHTGGPIVPATSSNESAAAPSSNPGIVANPNNVGEVVKHHTEEMIRKADELKRKGNQWWRQSLTNVQKSVSEAALIRRHTMPWESEETQAAAAAAAAAAEEALLLAEEETTVWQLEAAHLQTYYFVSVPSVSSGDAITDDEAIPPRSIGPFPSVTDNLRKSDKIRFIRNDDDPHSLKLYLPEEQYFVSCSSRGIISATKQEDDEGTEWILQDGPEGSVFRSRRHGLYLTLRDVPEENSGRAVPPANAFADGNGTSDGTEHNNKRKSKEIFENLQKMLPQQKKKIPLAELCGTSTPTSWKLEPCTPRAISSKRLKTFAIGTSIAVGTTIAMPFALAGVAAAMGALGAEAGIGFGIVAAGLSGAEALASVGAIGATAYFCFRPEQNSLGGPETELADQAGTPWSKRPFSNWRNW